MKVTLNIWRQSKQSTKQDFKQDGKMVRYELDDVSSDMSFLEMLDVLNEGLIKKGEEPVAFDHDCREGITTRSPLRRSWRMFPTSAAIPTSPPSARVGGSIRRTWPSTWGSTGHRTKISVG